MTVLGVTAAQSQPPRLPAFELPSFSWDKVQQLIPVALTISLVSFMESIAVAKAIESKHKTYKIDANKELVALGLSNVFGSFFQSYPVTGGFSRTAVNDQAGAKTGLASVFSAILVGLTLLFLTPLFYFLPNAILASVIMVAVFGLIDWKEAVHLWKADKADFLMLLVTFVATLAMGIEEGIAVGVILSLAIIIYRTAYPHHASLAKVPGSHFYRNLKRFDGLENREDILIMRFDAQLYFANISHFRNALEDYIKDKGEELKLVILNFDSINNIDSSAITVLTEIIQNGAKDGIQFYLSGVKGPVRDKFQKSHILIEIGEENMHMSIQEAVDAFDNLHEGKEHSEYVMQTEVEDKH